MSFELVKINGWDTFEDKSKQEVWITGKELGVHLQYDDPSRGIIKVYNRHQDKFIDGKDTSVVRLTTEGITRETRVFSERGSLKVVRYSSTDAADNVFDEICDVYLAYKKGKLEVKPKVQIDPRYMLPRQKAVIVIESHLRVAEMFDVPKHIAQTEATKEAEMVTGIDYSQLLLKAPAQDNIQEEDKMLEPVDIGKILGVSGIKVNKVLESFGYQKREGRTWVPTELGKKYSVSHHWKRKNKTGYNFKWSLDLLKKLISGS